MRIQKIFQRLKKVSPFSIPSLYLIKRQRLASESSDRKNYLYKKSPINSFHTKRNPVILGLLHHDVFHAGFASNFEKEFKTDTSSIIETADRALANQFNLLGSGWVDFNEFKHRGDLKQISLDGKVVSFNKQIGRIPWHFDFKAGVSWDPETFFSDISVGTVEGVDIKVPWELSRSNHLISFGQSYLLTKNEKYLEGFRNHILDWIESNPVKFGVNWSCPMDIALRACNWIFAYEFFSTSFNLDDDFLSKFLGSLWEHGNHIYQYREWNAEVSSNHYLSNLLGLFYIGTFLGVSEWVQFAIKEFSKHIFIQTFDDGFDFEGSTSYHRLVLEIFFFYALAHDRNLDSKLSGPFLKRLDCMMESLQQMLYPNGQAVFIGDNDSGRVHRLSQSPEKDFRDLLQMGTVFLDQHNLKVENWPIKSDLVWCFGFEGLNKYLHTHGISASEIPSKISGPSGFISIRGESDVVFFSAMPNGLRGMGNHTHNDKLSFTLYCNGDEFFTDPGTGVYTSQPELRNKLRSTSSHNTVRIDQTEQNDFINGDLFSLKDQTAAVLLSSEPNWVDAFHYGYLKNGINVEHRRSIERKKIQELQWDIEDEFIGEGSHDLEWNFVLNPSIRIEQVSSRLVLHGENGQLLFDLGVFKSPFEILETEYSPAYGIVQKTKKIQVKSKQELPFKIKFNLIYRRKTND